MALRAVRFSEAELWRAVRDTSESQDEATDHARYLASYLRKSSPPARSFVIETGYVDRHYLEEFTGYYATKLNPPKSKTARLHFLATAMDDRSLHEILERASVNYQAARDELNAAYIGFVVVRPIPGAPFGRTVLRPYSDKPSRCFAAASSISRVHFAGIELEVHGLPFQQQDQGVGACATASLWSALAGVMRNDGMRPATPFAVTRAATEHVLSSRAFPANGGLDLTQMLGALRAFGYSPHVFKPGIGTDIDKFLLALRGYLRSGIPVVLQVKPDDGDGHAVVCAGYRESDAEESASPLRYETPQGFQLRATGMSRVYVHDDRLGPYASAQFVRSPDTNDGDAGVPPAEILRLRIDPYERGFEKFTVPARVRNAIVPLYPKLRLTAEDVVGFAAELLPLAREIAREKRDEIDFDVRFVLSGRYLRELFDARLGRARTRRIVSRIELSRYVAVLQFKVADEWFLQAVFDSTDIRREGESMPLLLLIARDAKVRSTIAVAREIYPSAAFG